MIKELSIEMAQQLLRSNKYKYLLEMEELELEGPDLTCYQVGDAVVIYQHISGESYIEIASEAACGALTGAAPTQNQDHLSELCQLLKQLIEDKGYITLFQTTLLDCTEFTQTFDVLHRQQVKSYIFSDNISDDTRGGNPANTHADTAGGTPGDTKTEAVINQNIKKLSPDDAELAEAFECKEQLPYRRYSLAQIFDILVRRNQGAIYAYILNGRIIGYLSAVPSFEDVWDTDFVYVLPEYRGCGIGVELAKAYAVDRQNQGFRAYWSSAINEHSEAVALRAGFRLVRDTVEVDVRRKT